MAKRKRGGFSFLEATRPKVQPVVKKPSLQNGILIENTSSVNFLQSQRNQILSIIQQHIESKFLSGTKYESYGNIETLFILLNIEISTANVLKDLKRHFKFAKGFVKIENKHRRVYGNDIEPINNSKDINSGKENVTEQRSSGLGNKNNADKKKLSIDLTLLDVEGLLDFLKYRPINRQTRERYVEPLPDKTKTMSSNISDSNRSTFIAKDISFDKDSVEVYVNGNLSADICCYVEEKTDAYILHLFHKGAKQYSKSIAISKEGAKEPLQRIRYNDKDNHFIVNGKNLALTFEGYDAYRRDVVGNAVPIKNDDSPSIKYIGQPKRERKTAIVKQTTLNKDNDGIIVSITEEPLPKILDTNNSSSEDVKSHIQQILDTKDTNLKFEEIHNIEEKTLEIDLQQGVTEKNKDEVAFKKGELNTSIETDALQPQRDNLVDKTKKVKYPNKRNESYLQKIWHWLFGSLLMVFVIKLLHYNKKENV